MQPACRGANAGGKADWTGASGNGKIGQGTGESNPIRSHVSEAQPADPGVRNIDWPLTVDADRRVMRDAAVAVKDGRFVAIGKHAQIFPSRKAA